MNKASGFFFPQPQKKEETQQSRKSSPKSTEPVMDLLGLGKCLCSSVVPAAVALLPIFDLVGLSFEY